MSNDKKIADENDHFFVVIAAKNYRYRFFHSKKDKISMLLAGPYVAFNSLLTSDIDPDNVQCYVDNSVEHISKMYESANDEFRTEILNAALAYEALHPDDWLNSIIVNEADRLGVKLVDLGQIRIFNVRKKDSLISAKNEKPSLGKFS